MAGRFVELLKCSILALTLLSLTCAVGCGDNATVIEAPATEEDTDPEDPMAPAKGMEPPTYAEEGK